MKRVILMIFAIGMLCISCSKEEVKMEYATTKEEAEEIIYEWIFNDYNPDMNPSLSISLVEYTTNEIYTKLGGQVFGIVADVPGLVSKWVFLKNKVVYDLLPGYQYSSEVDLNNLLVTDLNSDNIYELVYTAHSGSGILYQNINCFYSSENELPKVRIGFFCRFPLNYKIHLQKESFQKVNIKYKDNNYDLNIGKPKLINQESGLEFIVELNENIPQEIIDNLNGN